MNKTERERIIKTTWEIHNQVEKAYLNNSSKKGDTDWLEKQRILLADMALHLLQTSLNPGEINLNHLRNNLHAILTISDQFLPKAELKEATNNLYESKN
jgi:hypothetical protein